MNFQQKLAVSLQDCSVPFVNIVWNDSDGRTMIPGLYNQSSTGKGLVGRFFLFKSEFDDIVFLQFNKSFPYVTVGILYSVTICIDIVCYSLQ